MLYVPVVRVMVFIVWGALTHWGRVTHICVGKLNIIGSDNGLSPGRRQAIIWTNAGILLIEPLGTKFNETLIEIHTFSFKKMHLKMSSAKRRPFCLGPNVLMAGNSLRLRETMKCYLSNVYFIHLPLDKMAPILADNNLRYIFLNENDRILIGISLKFVPRSPIDNKSTLVQVMAWRRTGDKPLPEPMLTQLADAYMRY